jgi:antitoxin component YwqK of YwqJK toxin-antitoxin module
VKFLIVVLLFPASAYAEVTREAFIKRNGTLELVFYIKGKKIARQVWDNDGDHVRTTGIIPNGIVKHHYVDGTVWEIPYKNNRAEGVSKIYDKYGALKVKSNYTNGKLDGISKVYSAGGNLIGELHYKQGRLLKKIEYGGKSKPIAEQLLALLKRFSVL